MAYVDAAWLSSFREGSAAGRHIASHPNTIEDLGIAVEPTYVHEVATALIGTGGGIVVGHGECKAPSSGSRAALAGTTTISPAPGTLGGGAVLDAVGFAAAAAHRGVRLVRVPTTTLAQADSGVGVKNGINAFGKKNFLGTFSPPWAVINDEAFLQTLSDRDWRCGIAEAVKVALLKSERFFDQIGEAVPRLRMRDEQALIPIVRRSAWLHLHHITDGGDPFELRDFLDNIGPLIGVTRPGAGVRPVVVIAVIVIPWWRRRCSNNGPIVGRHSACDDAPIGISAAGSREAIHLACADAPTDAT